MNKALLITGCSQGIGRAIASYFLKQKWRVFGIDFAPCSLPLDKFFQRDVSKIETFEEVAVELSKGQINLGCIVNNAAIQIAKPLIETTQEDWRASLDTNLSSMFYSAKSLYHLTSGGSIINIASVHARATSLGMCAYATSKGAVCAFTRSAALELAEHGIRVNAILPGAVDTDMLRQGLSRNGDPSNALAKIVATTPLKRVGEGLDIAKLTFFLADKDLSANITGQEFICDSGVLARLASE